MPVKGILVISNGRIRFNAVHEARALFFFLNVTLTRRESTAMQSLASACSSFGEARILPEVHAKWIAKLYLVAHQRLNRRSPVGNCSLGAIYTAVQSVHF